MKINIRHKLILYLAIILAGNGFIGYAVYQGNQKMADSEQLIQHTEKVISLTDNILSQSNEIVIASRGFIITNDSSFLEPELLQETIFNYILQLQQLIRDNPSQQKRVDSLNCYMHKYLSFSYQAVELRKAQGLSAAVELISTRKGKQNTDKIRQITASIQLEESALLNKRKEINHQSVAVLKWLAGSIFALMDVSTFLLLIFFGKSLFQNEEKERWAAQLVIAKEKAEESDNLKTAFIRNMSHEIRTPLNAIIGFSSLLNDEETSKEDIKEFTSLINQSGKRLIEMVNNILDISSIQTGQVEIRKKPIFIESIFSDLLSFFTPISIAKNIDLKYHNQGDKLRMINSDEAKVYQIIGNLISNSIKFSKSGSIDFGYIVKDELIQFYVKDTGIGIPEALCDKVFDSFRQVEFKMSRGYEGSGLGLSICKGLVGLLGGRIWVESEINLGTTFFFTIPYNHLALVS